MNLLWERLQADDVFLYAIREGGRGLPFFYYCLVMVYCVKYYRSTQQAAGDSARVFKKKEVYGLCTEKTVQIDIL